MALSPSEVKKLKVLGVVVVFLVLFHGYRTWKKGSGRARVSGRRGRAATTARRASRPRRGAPARGRGGAKPKSRRGRALTPRDIPKLTEDTKSKLKALKNPKVDLISEDELRYETRNPFLPIDVSDKQVEQMKREAEVKAKGGKMAADIIYFRGVAHINGERLAILERADRTIPWYVREGERLTDTDFILKNIASNDMQVNLLNTRAKRERDRIRTVPWTGLEGVEELAAGAPPPGGPSAKGLAVPGGPPVPGAPPLEKPDGGTAPSEDDFEIME